MSCDDCKFYHWYYDRCDKWNCEVDAREVHNCYEPMATPLRDVMVGEDMNGFEIIANKESE